MNPLRRRERAQISSGPEVPKYLLVQNPDYKAKTSESLQLAVNTNTNITANAPTVRERREARLNEMRTRHEEYETRTDAMLVGAGGSLERARSLINPMNLAQAGRMVYFRLPRQIYMQREIRLAEEMLARESAESIQSVEVDLGGRDFEAE